MAKLWNFWKGTAFGMMLLFIASYFVCFWKGDYKLHKRWLDSVGKK